MLAYSNGFQLCRPRPVLAVLYALAASALLCYPTWPGLMSFDSLFAYKESLEGIVTAVWPPAQAYSFYLSRAAGAGVWGVFIGQAFILLFSAALIFSMAFRTIAAVVTALLVFSLAFVWFPTLWGTFGVLWKDVTTTSFALLGLALWLLAIRTVSYAWLVAGAAAFAVHVALRYNAFPLTFFVMALMAACPFGFVRRPNARLITSAVLLGGLGLAFISMKVRLPDFRVLPSGTGLSAVQEFDLLGISACEGVNLLPPGVSDGAPVSAADLQQLYDPRHVQLAFRHVPGVPVLLETDADGAVESTWFSIVPQHVGCYLKHRMAVFREQMGLSGPVFYPTHPGIDANDYGLALAHPALTTEWVGYILRSSNSPFRRAYLLYGLAILGVIAALFRRVPNRLLLSALLFGAMAYPCTLFFVGPAADARYIFPSNVFCVLLIIVSFGAVARTARR